MFANDAVFDALAHSQCRQILTDLLHRDPRPVPELSEEGRELLDADEALLGELLSSSRELSCADSTLVLLYHVHLPMLAEFGFITWHRNAHTVTRGPHFDDVKPFLELLTEQQDDRPATGAGTPIRS